MTPRSRLSETRSLSVGVAVVVSFLAVLEAARRLDLGPGVLGDRPLAVAAIALAGLAFYLAWMLTESAFD